jgi:NAD(P)-dependent dehydrogenase (short-subunit alcohol dehydrogenase family)
MSGLAGKAILITGASRGIGAATARVAHREGAVVVAHYGANRAAAHQLSDEFGGSRIHLVAGDLTDPTQTRHV